MTEHYEFNPGQHENNLNTIRLILAILVVVSHSFPLALGETSTHIGTKGVLEPLVAFTNGQESLGSLAVDVFFVISGMLITASWFRSSNMQNFILRRVLRIYPGFIASMFFSAVVAWLFCPEFRRQLSYAPSLRRWWGSYLLWSRQFLNDLVLLSSGSLYWKGMFLSNPEPSCANGSIWTIPIEFACYLIVAAVGMFALLHRRGMILLATVGIWVLYAATQFLAKEAWRYDLRFFAYFTIGMCACLYRDRLKFSVSPAIGCLVILVFCARFNPFFSILFPIAGSYFILWLGFGSLWPASRWTLKTDLSYGVYLFAFPIQQVLAMSKAMRTPALNMAAAIPLTLGIAWLSWHIIEKRFLRLKSKRFIDFDPARPTHPSAARVTEPNSA